MVSSRKKILSFAITALGLLALFLVAVNTGSLKVMPLELFKGLFIEYNENVATIYDLRFPRILIAIFGGAATAVSGVLLQAVMKNPLADPGIIGVSSGASLTAVLITAFVPTLYFFTPAHSLSCCLGGRSKAMDNNVFTVKNLSFAYGKQQVLKHLDLELHEGKITTLIGANGCGKSTLFNLMTKNLRPDEGEILLRGGDIVGMRLKDFAKEVSIVHQYNTAPVDLSVEKLVGYGRTPYHTMGLSPDPKEDEEKIHRAMEITHTYKHKDKPVSELSGGQKQRVWIAMALAQDTKVLFLDEPTTYLDIRYQLQILKLIRQLNREYGITIVMVLHDINQSLYYSDEIVAMKDGKMIAHGLPEEILTSELVKEVYDVELDIRSVDGKPFVIPV